MPRICLTDHQKLLMNIERRTYDTECLMLKHKIKKKEVAKILGITPQAVTNQFSNRKITFDTFVAVQMLVEQKGEQ